MRDKWGLFGIKKNREKNDEIIGDFYLFLC